MSRFSDDITLYCYISGVRTGSDYFNTQMYTRTKVVKLLFTDK